MRISLARDIGGAKKSHSRQLTRHVSPTAGDEVLQELSRHGRWNSAREIFDSLTGGRARIQYSILVNSRGDKHAVKYWVEEANKDFRDVLLAAGTANTDFPFW